MVFVSSVLFSRVETWDGMHTHTRPIHSCSGLVKVPGYSFINQGSREKKALLFGGARVTPVSGSSDSLQLMALNTSSPFVKFLLTANDEATCQAALR